MNEHFDLVIFDCDGVLVDSEIIAVEIDKRICADLGWQLTTEEIVERFLGKSSASFERQIEEHLGIVTCVASSGSHEKIRTTLGHSPKQNPRHVEARRGFLEPL